MGVPGFFMWLMKQYKTTKIVFSRSDVEKNDQFLESGDLIDYILIDMNCMIHPECFKTLDENANKTLDIDKIEAKMRNNIITYLEKIIDHVKPVRGIYIAIDGVAPVAKMKQQRMRRFKSVHDNELYTNLRKKHKKPSPLYWNNSAITPGTKFMKLLNLRIIDWMNEYCKKKKIEIIYSSSNVPSEGEHKLLQFIRNNQKLNKPNYNYVIYGLDADLIFLALSTGLDSIFLMREGKILKNDMNTAIDGFNFVSIKIMKECIVKSMSKLIKDTVQIDKNRLIDDFIFICYLMGNDFLPHLPSLDIYNGAIDILITKYVETISMYPGNYIVIRKPHCDINVEIFYDFIGRLAIDEEATLITKYNKKQYRSSCFSTDMYDIEVHRIENLQFKINDPIKLGSDNMELWRARYYSHNYNVNNDDDSQIDNFVQKMVYHYMVGLKWVTCYYFDKCPSWDWYYPYDHPPFIMDMNSNKIDINNINFQTSIPMSPFEQLLTVLPKQSSYLLPKELRKIMLNINSSVAHLYPTKFELDMIGKSKYWMAHPILPNMEINLIKKIFEKYSHKLTLNLREMNSVKDVMIVTTS